MNHAKTFLLVIFLLACAFPAFAETITMTTYYPSPAGNYSTLNVTGSLIFTSGAQSYFAGINGGNFFLNTGVASNAATGMVITNTGNIGIKMVPTVPLHVAGAITATGTITGGALTTAGAVTGASLSISGASALAAVTATTISGTTLTATGAISGNGITSTGTLTVRGATALNTTGGTTVIGVGAATADQLRVYGNVRAVAYLHSSDERLKEEIVPITGAIEKVKAMNGVYFKFKGTEEKKIGLIAQEVEKVFPEVVVTDNDGMKSVDYSSLVAALIQAVKEQQVMIEELQGKTDRKR